MKHFYNLYNTNFESIDFSSDILAMVREEYYDSYQAIKEKFTFNSNESSVKYDIQMNMNTSAKWNVTENDNVLASSRAINDNEYAICFYNKGQLFKKLTFTNKHVLSSLEYYFLSDSSVPACTIEPRRSKIGLCLIITYQGNPNQEVLYSYDFKIDDLQRIKDGITTPIVISSTDDGIVLFLSNSQKEQYDIILQDIVKENIEKEKPISFIKEADMSLANLLDPTAFNTKRNLASSVDITFAEEFIPDYDNLEEPVVEVTSKEDEPDKIINKEKGLKYFGYLDDNNMRQGYGRTSICDGKTAYEGYYHNDMRDGEGAYFYKDGTLCYYGDWKDNKRNGVGFGISSKNKAIHVGSWKDNAPFGDGVRLNKNGEVDFIIKELKDQSYLQISFSDNDMIIISKFDKNDKLIASKGFNIQ